LLTGRRLWVPDQIEQLNQLVVDLMRERRRQSADIANTRRTRAFFNWTHSGESRKRITNSLALCTFVLAIADAGDSWDRDPWSARRANGVVDLRNGELRNAQSEDRITMRRSYAYEPGATCPLWETTISQNLQRQRAA
jgi:putative DNA primase/helicase